MGRPQRRILGPPSAGEEPARSATTSLRPQRGTAGAPDGVMQGARPVAHPASPRRCGPVNRQSAGHGRPLSVALPPQVGNCLLTGSLVRSCPRLRAPKWVEAMTERSIRSMGEPDAAAPTPPSVAGVGHGSEPPWLTHRIDSTRAVSTASRTRTVVAVVLSANRGRCSGRSARSVASPAGIWVTSSCPTTYSLHGRTGHAARREVSGHPRDRSAVLHQPQQAAVRIDEGTDP